MRLAAAVVAFFGATCPLGAFTAQAADSKVELYPFASLTLSDADLLRGDLSRGTKVLLAGELSLPLESEGRLPAVVLLHGSAGVFPYVTQTRDELVGEGVAAFVVDSFSPRGIRSTIGDQDQLGRLNAIVDAYEALKVLQAHRRIDPSRVVVMGFSRGADAALYASLRRMKDALAPSSSGFAAHVAFYPNCGTHYRRDTETTGVPIRLFNGTADDFAPIAPCRAYVDRLRASGADVALIAYEGAHAVFMWSSLTKPEVLESAQTTRSCQLAERDDGTVVNAKTGMAFSHKDTCVQKGGTVGYNAAAAADARKRVKVLIEGLRKQ